MISPNTVTAIKGNTISGSIFATLTPFEGVVDLDTDFTESPWREMGLAQSSEGVSVAKSADSNVVVAWGDNEIDEVYSNTSASVTTNLFSFKSINTLKALFGESNVVKTGSTIRVSCKSTQASDRISIAIVGVDKRGKAAILYCPIASIDPNFEFTWNDTDPVAVPAVFKLKKKGDIFYELILEDDEDEDDL